MKNIKKLDILLIGFYLILSIGGAVYFMVDGLQVHSGMAEVVISVENKEYERLSLPVAQKKEIIIETTLGRNVIIVEGENVYMQSSDCDDQICVRRGKISKAKEMIVCLPNEVLVEIIGREKREVDQIAQ